MLGGLRVQWEEDLIPSDKGAIVHNKEEAKEEKQDVFP